MSKGLSKVPTIGGKVNLESTWIPVQEPAEPPPPPADGIALPGPQKAGDERILSAR